MDDLFPPGCRRVYVDAMNVIGSRPDGWWRDRPAAVRRLVASLERGVADRDVEVVVVVDGSPLPDVPETAGASAGRAVTVRYARRRGPDGADDRLVELLAAGRTDGVVVVTADRALRDRVAQLGAGVVRPRALRSYLDEVGAGPVDDGVQGG